MSYVYLRFSHGLHTINFSAQYFLAYSFYMITNLYQAVVVKNHTSIKYKGWLQHAVVYSFVVVGLKCRHKSFDHIFKFCYLYGTSYCTFVYFHYPRDVINMQWKDFFTLLAVNSSHSVQTTIA